MLEELKKVIQRQVNMVGVVLVVVKAEEEQ